MKKRVRIYKAGGEQGMVTNPLSKWMMQMGGVPQAQPQQMDEEQIMNILDEAYMSMIEPEDLYEALLNNYKLPEEEALYYIDLYNQKLNEKQSQEISTPDNPNLAAPEEIYLEDTEPEFKYGGAKQVSKKTFVNNILKNVKKQAGGIINQSDKPEDAPGLKTQSFLNAVNKEKMLSEAKKEAEGMYDNFMQRGGFVDESNPFYGNPDLYKFIGGGSELNKAQGGKNVNELERSKQIAKSMGYTGSDPVGFLEYMRAADMQRRQGYLPGDVPGAKWYPGQAQLHSPWHSQAMGRLGPVYPPLFGGRWNAGIQYAGSWLKPGKVTQKTTSWSDLTKPRTSSTFIDSEGRVKYNAPTSEQITPQTENTGRRQRSMEEGEQNIPGRALWRYPKIGEYTSTQHSDEPQDIIEFNDDTYRGKAYDVDEEGNTIVTTDKGQRIVKRNTTKRTFADGGLIKAQSGFGTCPPGYSKDMNPSSPSYGQCVSATGQVNRQPSSTLSTPFEYTNPFIQEDVVGIDPESGMYRNMDLPEQNMGMTETETEYDPQRMWNIDGAQLMNNLNTGVRAGLKFMGERGDRANMLNMYANTTADNVYLPNPWSRKQRGLYDPNSGLIQPGLMGSTYGSGYAMRQSGGAIDDEVEMTEEELRQFIANGGEVEYL